MVDLERTLRWNGAQRDDLAFFAGLQANILKGHGRKHVRLLFIQFDGDRPEEARSLIKKIARDITSTRDQFTQAQLRQSRGRPGGPLVSLMLTASAYQLLGLGPWPGGPETMNLADMEVSRDSASRLFRRHVAKDEDAARAGKIHALLLIAHGNDASDPGAINHVESNYYNLIYSDVSGSPVARVVGRERGTLLEQRGLPREHFGYPDGRSQVLVMDEDIEAERLKSGGSFVAWDPSVPASRVVTGVKWLETVEEKDRKSERWASGYGSFFVFQKWEQNVRAFSSQIRQSADKAGKVPGSVEALSKALRASGGKAAKDGLLPAEVTVAANEAAHEIRSEAAKAGADVLGRFDDGFPRTLGDVTGIRTDVPNDFEYDGPAARPSHMQAVNPRLRRNRLATVKGAWHDPVLFVRRGMPYDDRPGGERQAHPTPGEGGFVYDPSEYPDRDVGLLFMGYNSDLREQFLEAFKRVHAGDQLVKGTYQPPGRQRTEGEVRDLVKEVVPIQKSDEQLRKEAEENAPKPFVTLKGGEYFFVPPIRFLQEIDGVVAPPPAQT
jgi:deferrochelatase/peroxidase EfeB